MKPKIKELNSMLCADTMLHFVKKIAIIFSTFFKSVFAHGFKHRHRPSSSPNVFKVRPLFFRLHNHIVFDALRLSSSEVIRLEETISRKHSYLCGTENCVDY
jgi:hypothetical protein